jgi:hypothetical protein
VLLHRLGLQARHVHSHDRQNLGLSKRCGLRAWTSRSAAHLRALKSNRKARPRMEALCCGSDCTRLFMIMGAGSVLGDLRWALYVYGLLHIGHPHGADSSL